MLRTILPTFSFIANIASEEFFFFFFFFENLAFPLPWRPIKLRGMNKTYNLVEDHSANISEKLVKISAMK